MNRHPTAHSKSSLADRYRVLLGIGRTLTGTLALDELYRAVWEGTRTVLDADGFYIALQDEARDEARVVFFADGAEEKAPDIVFRASDSLVIRTGEALLVEDGLQGRSLFLLGDDPTRVTRSGLSAPLRWKGNVLGTVSAQSYRPNAFDEVDLELLQGIADLAAVAIENARQVAELRRKRREAERIEQIGRAVAGSLETQVVLQKIIDAALDLVDGAEGASVWLLQSDGEARVAAAGGSPAFPLGLVARLAGSPFAEVADDARSVTLPDLGAGAVLPEELREHLAGGSGAAVPLDVAGEVAGILFCGRPEGHPMGEVEVRILQRLASQASVALGNARLHESLQSLSLTDPLTGLANRRHLRMHLDREVAAARRGRSLQAVMFDLDRFKQYNDTYGHVAGDGALRAFARVLQEENRAMNLVARYGGDEFVSVLTDTSRDGARQYVDRVLTRIRAEPLLSAAEIQVTWGVGTFDPETMEGADDLIAAADAHFYRWKERRSTRGEP